ncbi:heme o synthase [Robertmurraya massiliosenegalensis]|uniref:heme o synthase n=1 Tax=Robertmurraya massiliosenegalensis TaxID=1287657 RepID=UPI0002DA53B1|nr:heme o synthase [Robertmurraya massiliosenegalensis]
MSDLRALSEMPSPNCEQGIQGTVPKTNAWKDFLALIKVGIVNSNMITTFTGLWLALYFTNTSFLASLDIIFFTLAGSALIIAGSCAINNFYDRDIDPLMERTKTRPTVTGKVSGTATLLLGVAFVAVGIIFLLLTTFTATLIGIVGIVSYVFLYTMWTKRKYVSNTIVGSISGAVPPLIGWAAIDPSLDVIAWSLFFIMFAWQPPHFYALAMRRVEEYRAAGIPMLPVIKGFDVTKKHILAWVIILFPVPFLLTSLGIPFLILATLLNIGWLFIGINGYRKKDDIKWAKSMFVYSLQYMTIMFVAMVIVTLV